MSDSDEGAKFTDGTKDFKFKLILIGESRVGKTSIIAQLCKGEFNEE